MTVAEDDAPEAPGRLALVEEFVNTVELPDGEDRLGTVPSARAWLAAHDVAAPALQEASRRQLVDLREALRHVLEGTERGDVPADAAELVMQRLNAARLAVVISPSGVHTHPAEGAQGLDALYAELAAAMITATIDGTWQRLKVCHNDECRWAFYDRSKNVRRAWCSMRSCGCQAKSRAYRARKRESSSGAGG